MQGGECQQERHRRGVARQGGRIVGKLRKDLLGRVTNQKEDLIIWKLLKIREATTHQLPFKGGKQAGCFHDANDK